MPVLGAGALSDENIDDRVNALLVAGTNVTKTYDDTANTLTLDAAGGSGTFAGAKAYRSAALNLTHDATTMIPWDTELWDTDSFHSTVTNLTRFTVPSGMAGKYRVECSAPIQAGFTCARLILQMYVNGAAARGGWAEMAVSNSSTYPGMTLTTVLDLAVGDYAEAGIYQDSGSTRTLYVGSAGNGMSFTKIG